MCFGFALIWFWHISETLMCRCLSWWLHERRRLVLHVTRRCSPNVVWCLAVNLDAPCLLMRKDLFYVLFRRADSKSACYVCQSWSAWNAHLIHAAGCIIKSSCNHRHHDRLTKTRPWLASQSLRRCVSDCRTQACVFLHPSSSCADILSCPSHILPSRARYSLVSWAFIQELCFPHVNQRTKGI